MTRDNGFIALDKYRKRSQEEYRERNQEEKNILWQDAEWFYKWCENKNSCINEVFWSYVLKYLPVKSIECDMIKQGRRFGVISKNYNPKDCYTFSMAELINFYQKMTGRNPKDMDYSYETMIEVYQCAFGEYGEENLIQLKKETLDQFITQILLGNGNLCQTNMGIIMNPNPEMVPLHDYMRCGRVILGEFVTERFKFEYSGSSIFPNQTFLKFLEMAPKEELETLRMFMTAIEELRFKHLFEEMESNIEKKIPQEQKETLKYLARRNTFVAEKMIRKREISI